MIPQTCREYREESVGLRADSASPSRVGLSRPLIMKKHRVDLLFAWLTVEAVPFGLYLCRGGRIVSVVSGVD